MDAVVYEYNMERVYRLAIIYLLPDAELLAAVSEGAKEATVLGENDGYTYVLTTYDYTVSVKDDPAIVEAARVRVNEMIASMQYQPVVISEEELAGGPETVLPNAFPSFTTQDLSGNTVDNSIFAKADLTVLNLWGTTCAPCITEMPELQEWNENMPENVQLVGLVLDAAVGDADALETAQMICEATGFTTDEMCIFGDRLYTDIAVGKKHGVTAVLVLSGETTPEDVDAATPADQPDMVYDSLDNVDHLMFG
jgi:thiol-disulfide isomerase/thioredoxin